MIARGGDDELAGRETLATDSYRPGHERDERRERVEERLPKEPKQRRCWQCKSPDESEREIRKDKTHRDRGDARSQFTTGRPTRKYSSNKVAGQQCGEPPQNHGR